MNQTLPLPRPRYRIWDRELRCWYTPTHRAYLGVVDELLVSPDGSLMRRTLHRVEHESTFSGRFVVLLDLDTYTPCLN